MTHAQILLYQRYINNNIVVGDEYQYINDGNTFDDYFSHITCSLLVEYVILYDKVDRDYFTQKNNKIENIVNVVEKVSYPISLLSSTNTIDLFYPCKYFIWMISNNALRLDNYASEKKFNTFENCNSSSINFNFNPSTKLSHNENMYYNYYVPYKKFNNIPINGVMVYSFALNPTNNNIPSGNCNFNKKISLTYTLDFQYSSLSQYSSYMIDFYFVYYNILNIENGFSNLRLN
jgi:hypothetical protein